MLSAGVRGPDPRSTARSVPAGCRHSASRGLSSCGRNTPKVGRWMARAARRSLECFIRGPSGSSSSMSWPAAAAGCRSRTGNGTGQAAATSSCSRTATSTRWAGSRRRRRCRSRRSSPPLHGRSFRSSATGRAVAVPRWCAATCTPRTRCSIPGFVPFRRCSWCDRPRALPHAGSKPTSRTRLRNHPVGDPRPCPGGCRSCCSSRCCGYISPRPPRWSAAGWRHCEIRCSRRRWPCSMPHPSGNGLWRSWPQGLRYRVPCLTVASGRFLGGRRSAISPSGECTSPKSCW